MKPLQIVLAASIGLALFSGNLKVLAERGSEAAALPLTLAEAPPWVNQLAADMQRDSRKRGTEIYVNRYQNQPVYYVTAPCCDQHNPLYSQDGNVLCHPDGGIHGRGDSRCADYPRKDQTLLFKVTPKTAQKP